MTGEKSGVLLFTTGDVGYVLTGIKRIKHFRWVGATTAGHKCVVTGMGGDVIWESEADGARFIDVHPYYKFVNNMTLNTMDSGKLYVYLE